MKKIPGSRPVSASSKDGKLLNQNAGLAPNMSNKGNMQGSSLSGLG